MKKHFYLFLLLLLSVGCKQSHKNNLETEPEKFSEFSYSLFSQSVQDSFYISVSLPENYSTAKNVSYPVVYLLDANFYFDIAAATFNKYAEVGLLPPVILVGIGYKDLITMDSLRDRDFTYPAALPEYEMISSGKADRFLHFLTTELIPATEKRYQVDSTQRILSGHSLGGYFTLYALQQQLKTKNNVFNAFIAASPSTHYNHNYILKEFETIHSPTNDSIKCYVTFGGLEEEEEEASDSTLLTTDEVLVSLSSSLKEKNKITFQSGIYSNLEHMDTALPGFIKGLQWVLHKGE